MELRRGFVAVVPPGHVLDAIDVRLAPVRAAYDGVRWSRRDQWHLTLRFLGVVPEVETVVGALRDALAVVPAVPAVQLARAGAFPNPRRAAVVWIGVEVGGHGLAGVADAIESASVAAGFAAEARPFTAHLTVARVPKPHDVGSLLSALGDGPVGVPWSVDDVVLVASDTRPTGAEYSEIARVPLATMER